LLFHEGIEEFVYSVYYEENFPLFERAAEKGHEEAKWIVSVVKNVEMDEIALKEAFAKADTPLGWWLAGQCSEYDSREKFDFFKKSAEAGCSWGMVEYGDYFMYGGEFVENEQDEKVYLEWLEKAANQDNPKAMNALGNIFHKKEEYEKALSYFRAAAGLGWKRSMEALGCMLSCGKGYVKDLTQAATWSARGDLYWVFDALEKARVAFENGTTDVLGCNLDQVCYSLGWGLYWYLYGTEDWKIQSHEERAFGNRCLDYYCENVELQRKSIFTFLLCWNQAVGIKNVGVMIAQMVWEGKEDPLVKPFKKGDGWGCILF
jgi:TPR repeat protein